MKFTKTLLVLFLVFITFNVTFGNKVTQYMSSDFQLYIEMYPEDLEVNGQELLANFGFDGRQIIDSIMQSMLWGLNLNLENRESVHKALEAYGFNTKLPIGLCLYNINNQASNVDLTFTLPISSKNKQQALIEKIAEKIGSKEEFITDIETYHGQNITIYSQILNDEKQNLFGVLSLDGDYIVVSLQIERLYTIIDQILEKRTAYYKESFQIALNQLGKTSQFKILVSPELVKEFSGNFNRVPENIINDTLTYSGASLTTASKEMKFISYGLIEGISGISKKLNKIFPDKEYKKNKNKINLFEYIPENPTLFFKVDVDYFKFIESIFSQNSNELKTAIDDLSEEVGIDIFNRYLKKIGYNHMIAIYNFNPALFLFEDYNRLRNKDLNFLAYTEFKDNETASNLLEELIELVSREEVAKDLDTKEVIYLGKNKMLLIRIEGFGLFISNIENYITITSNYTNIQKIIDKIEKKDKNDIEKMIKPGSLFETYKANNLGSLILNPKEFLTYIKDSAYALDGGHNVLSELLGRLGMENLEKFNSVYAFGNYILGSETYTFGFSLK